MVNKTMRLIIINCLLTLFCALISSSLYAQFNDSTHYYFNFASAGSINKTQDGKSHLLNNGLRFSVKKKSFVSNFGSSWIYGKQNSKLTNNDFSTTLDFNLYSTLPNFYYWGLANYNTSYSLNINNQLLTGLGIAYNILDKENQKLNISNGILYDNSDITLNSDEREIYSSVRNSFRLSFKFTIKQLIILESTSFLQSSLNYKNDYILRSANSVSFKLNQWLSLTSALNFNKITRTERENLLMSYGLKLEKYF